MAGRTVEPEFLIKLLLPGARVTSCEPLTGGVSAEVLGVTAVPAVGPAEALVIRRHRHLDGKPDRRERAAREYALLERLYEAGLPVPRPRLFVAPDTLIQERIDGSTELPADAPAQMAVVLATIHATGTAALPALPRCDDPLPDLRVWLEGSDELPAVLDALPPYAGEPVLLHGDFWPGNLLWRHGQLAAVLDWEDAALGDPLADVAGAVVELACMTGDAVAASFLDAYVQQTGISLARLPAWELYVATAALRYMDGWGLQPEELAARKAVTMARARAAMQAMLLR